MWLLHIGQLAMACGIPDAYEAVLTEATTRPQDLPAIEREKQGATHIDALADRLRAAIEEICLKTNGQSLRVTTSVGVALAFWPGRERTSAEIIHSADARLYEAKHSGCNCCREEETVQKAA